jgi:uncharacterized membrane protein HdeD (DUF308 family)
MTSASDTAQSVGIELAPLRAKWGWIVGLGVVYVVVGFIALGSIVAATVASVLVVGVMMIIAGVAEVINAFQIKSWGRFLFWGLIGVLYIIAGLMAFDDPFLVATVLTLFLGAALIASGVLRLFLAFSMMRESPWIWVAISAIISIVLGLLILAHWPINSVYILGLFLGIDLIMAGAGWIGMGLSLRRNRTEAVAA